MYPLKSWYVTGKSYGWGNLTKSYQAFIRWKAIYNLMDITNRSGNIVIVGAWNPAIINPPWLTKEVFDIPEEMDEPVKLEVSTNPLDPPKFTIRDVAFVGRRDRLMIIPSNFTEDNFQSVEDKSRIILDKLSHTPITAFGQNFEYLCETASGDDIDVFDFNDNIEELFGTTNYSLESTAIAKTLRLENHALNFTRILSGNILKVRFNFHYEVSSAKDARNQLENSIRENFKLANLVMAELNAEPETDGG